MKKFVESRNDMPCGLTVVIVAALIARIAGSDAQLGPRIVGGENDVIMERPYIVSVQGDNGHRCGGSIIGKNVILTADHCVPSGNPTDYKVHSGSSYTFKDGSTTRVKRIYRERESSTGRKADVAILELEEPLVFGPTRQPIKLWKTDWEIYVMEYVNVSGWGLNLKQSDLSWDGQLQTVVLELVDWHECATKIPSLKGHELCAWVREGGKDACAGDSGGPLVIEDAQLAVVAAGRDCGEPGVPGLYTNIIHVRNWIDRILRAVELINE